jgi:hypothetical protein
MKQPLWILATALVFAGCGVSKQVVAEKDAALEACTGTAAACEERLQASRPRPNNCARTATRPVRWPLPRRASGRP